MPESARAASLPGKRSRPRVEGGFAQPVEELAPEDATEDLHREKEADRSRRPSASHRGTIRLPDDAVDVRMMCRFWPQVCKHGQEADLGPQVLGIGGHLLQGFGGGPEQQAVDLPGIVQGDRAEIAGEREDHVEVRHGEQLGFPGLQPLAPRRWPGTWGSGGCGRSCRRSADARTAGTPGRARPGPPCGSRAMSSRARRCSGVSALAVPLEERVVTAPEDLGHFEPRSGHGWGHLRGQVEIDRVGCGSLAEPPLRHGVDAPWC